MRWRRSRRDFDAETLVLPFEATDWSALPGAVEAAWGWRDGIGLLVNNAGISQRSLALDTAPEVYDRILEVDLHAPIRLTQLVLPLMAARRTGTILMIASVAGRVGPVLRTAYAAAKHGLIGYADALRGEVETAHGLRVVNVLPGSIRTDVARNALQGDGSARGRSDPNIEAGMEPAECARRILQGLTEGRREIIVAEGLEAMAATLRWQNSRPAFRSGRGAGRQTCRGARRRQAGGTCRGQFHPLRQLMAAAHDLGRFIEAQEFGLAVALAELRAGRKQSHWMWFIFPQLAGLGTTSPMAVRYAIASAAEARACLADPVLGTRLREGVAAMLGHREKSAEAILGGIDALKFRSCLTLFEAVAGEPALFTEALDAFYDGARDERTLELLAR